MEMGKGLGYLIRSTSIPLIDGVYKLWSSGGGGHGGLRGFGGGS